MEKTPKSMRLQIGVFGPTNAGKSSFVNRITGQDVSITSSVPGTTTDVVEKAMELLPLGPVMFLDTAGIRDVSHLGRKRGEKTAKIFDRADVAVIICENGPEYNETEIISQCSNRDIPMIMVFNKIDAAPPCREKYEKYAQYGPVLMVSCTQWKETFVDEFKTALQKVLPDHCSTAPSLAGDLLPPGGHAVFIVPIDLQAPRGRLILPQVQAIRDILDSDCMVSVVKEREYLMFLSLLRKNPDLVVCDSQVMHKMVADTPADVMVTTFSILFARFKGELETLVSGLSALIDLTADDKILISEACSHHAGPDDIGRVKIPRWIRQFTGVDCTIDVVSGREYPPDLSGYSLVVHCGACMLTRNEMMRRLSSASKKHVPITNYGVVISFIQGGLRRVLSPFPSALLLYEEKIESRI
ncbi:MAG: [FeFe] hydrogenase H-cluster maturation GTPase HydF [Fibrobacterota bacterium]